MDMPYTTNPRLPRLRMQAAQLVLREGMSTRAVARHTGFYQSTVVRWVEEARHSVRLIIPTRSSRPHHHPHELPHDVVDRILALRAERSQCAELLHHRLMQEGVLISLSSVKRVLKRHRLSRFSRWKKWHRSPERPLPESPGVLVEVDTIHAGMPDERLYVYTLLDVCSRWAWALPSLRINTHRSVRFVRSAQEKAPFAFHALQSDHGSEFSKWFTLRVGERGMTHRHSRVRMPTDNGHLERFNRTLQQECLRRIPRRFFVWKKEIPEYLRYYNEERPHMGLDMRTPLEVMRSY